MNTQEGNPERPARRWVSLAVFILVCLMVAGIGGTINASAIQGWYANLAKPSWTPPGAVFGPVWTFLYLCIGIAGWLVWISPPRRERGLALRLWAVQLLLNFVWTPLFFGWKLPGWAAIDIVLLCITIGVFVVAARKVSPMAALLFVPYWAWVCFASALNIAIWWLNRAASAAG